MDRATGFVLSVFMINLPADKLINNEQIVTTQRLNKNRLCCLLLQKQNHKILIVFLQTQKHHSTNTVKQADKNPNEHQANNSMFPPV